MSPSDDTSPPDRDVDAHGLPPTAPEPDGIARIGLGRGGLPIDQAATIVKTGSSLVATFVATSALGFVFWWLAARTFPPADVGLSSAAVSAMLLLARLTSHGLGTSLAGALAERRSSAAALLAPGLGITILVAAGLGLAFAILARFISPGLAPLGEPPAALLFGIGVGLSAAGVVLDQAVVGLLRGRLQLLRNVVFAASKLGFLAVVAIGATDGGLDILGVWILGEALSLAVLAVLAIRGRMRPVEADWGGLQSLGRDAAGHHVLNVARFAPSLAMPLVVATMFSTDTNGLFYVAYLLASVTQLISSSSTFTLYAVARRHPEHLSHQVRLTLALSLATVIPVIVALAVFGTTLMGIFGPRYATETGTLLPTLALLAIPLVAKDHWIALTRIRGDVGHGALITTLGAGLELSLAVLGGVLAGLEGLALGWLFGASLAAAAQTPRVLRAAKIVR